MFNLVFKMLSSTTNNDVRILLGHSSIAFAQTKQTLSQLLSVVDGSKSIISDFPAQTIPNFEFDQAMRWQLVSAAMGMGITDAETRLNKELERDPSDRFFFLVSQLIQFLEDNDQLLLQELQHQIKR